MIIIAAASGMSETLENKGSDEWSRDHAAPLRNIPGFMGRKERKNYWLFLWLCWIFKDQKPSTHMCSSGQTEGLYIFWAEGKQWWGEKWDLVTVKEESSHLIPIYQRLVRGGVTNLGEVWQHFVMSQMKTLRRDEITNHSDHTQCQEKRK